MSQAGGILDPRTDIRRLEERMLTREGLIIPILGEEAVYNFTQAQISMFCYQHGLYTFPTTELIEFLRSQMDGLTIEICAGNGVIGRALGIRMFDNHMQERDYIQDRYTMQNQPPVKYGPDVENMDGIDVIKELSPKTVIANWCTQQWKQGMSKSTASGNMYGIEEQLIFRYGVEKYIHVGNENTHAQKLILKKYEYKSYKFPWLLSRSMDRDKNIIYIFD